MTAILKTTQDVHDFRQKNTDKKLGFVPTMGNLHDGHLSLINIAKKHSDTVIVSIFVNPTQFGPNEDLDAYPRTFEADLEKLKLLGVDAVFVPKNATIYPHGKDNTLSIEMPSAMINILCGEDRPTHFQGVATVVAKLFQIVQPNVAVFGKKDFQQLAIIRRLNKELFMNIDILSGEIIRENNGLAMSSRNQYLTDTDRDLAANLSKTLKTCRQRLINGDSVEIVLSESKALLNNLGMKVEYLDFRDKRTLAENPATNDGILLIAARVGTTRLIDNLLIKSQKAN